MTGETWRDADGPARRWWRGAGGPVPYACERLLRHARGHARRWSGAGRAAGPGVDQIEAERRLAALVAAGLVEIHERRDRRGDWTPYEWRLTAAGEAVVAEPVDDADATIRAWLAQTSPFEAHPALVRLREWLTAGAPDAAATEVRVALAIGADLRDGRRPRGRLVSIRVRGDSKAVRIDDHRALLEAVFEVPLEELVPPLAPAVLLAGALRLVVAGNEVDPGWSRPWVALPPETVAALDAVRTRATRLVTVENLLPFEEVARAGLPPDTIAFYTGGFPGRAERAVLDALVVAGIERVDHWGDLDVGGLRILRYLRDTLPIPVHPFRMDPALLDRLPTRPLTTRDREALEAWLADPEAPAHPLARALLAANAKAEQESWFLLPPTAAPPADGDEERRT